MLLLLLPLCPQPRSKQSAEIAPTVGFNVEEFQRGCVCPSWSSALVAEPLVWHSQHVSAAPVCCTPVLC